MEKQALLKNIDFAKPQDLGSMVEYKEGQVVSRTLCQTPGLSITLFAFAKGEGLSAHTVEADALVQVLDGMAEITIGNETMTASAGELVAMPQGLPHGLDAKERFKMLLTVVRAPQMPGIT
ncbi:cupin domain-containing protein [Dethiosulfatarculus sandiegensis]|uniref:Cupin n=1 Tax=Dethiosulfatarculus sandiegensis TaxID=1429043 RepID=A0A0D2JT21_9BACT|nr:cupin domain-containing protein [Dethiosulfatarculus sandiegensis]KIX12615.1 cupin [Dethiosulfatarculus sandiegensis]